MQMTSGNPEPRAPRLLRRRLVGTTLGSRAAVGEPSRPDADASDERIVELWLRDRPANTRVAYGRDYGRFRSFIGARSLRTIGLGDISRTSPPLSPARRRRVGEPSQRSRHYSRLASGWERSGLNVGAALRLPKVVSRRAERRLEEIEVFRLLTALDGQPRESPLSLSLMERLLRLMARSGSNAVGLGQPAIKFPPPLRSRARHPARIAAVAESCWRGC